MAPEIPQTTWSRFFDAVEPAHALVAEDNGALLGLVHYLFHRSKIQITPTCYLQYLFTSDAARGRGVGQAPIEAVYGRAAAAGTGRVYDKVAENSGFIVYKKQL